MQRVVVVGISGAGKTTLAAALAAQLGVPHVELDALWHGPGWVPRTDYAADVQRLTEAPGWVVDGWGHPPTRDLVWSRADTVVWLDLPRPVVVARVLRRSVRRAAGRTELWNGNRESLRDWLDPGHPVRWAWTQHATRRADVAAQLARHPGVTRVHLRTAAQVRAWR